MGKPKHLDPINGIQDVYDEGCGSDMPQSSWVRRSPWNSNEVETVTQTLDEVSDSSVALFGRTRDHSFIDARPIRAGDRTPM